MQGITAAKYGQLTRRARNGVYAIAFSRQYTRNILKVFLFNAAAGIGREFKHTAGLSGLEHQRHGERIV